MIKTKTIFILFILLLFNSLSAEEPAAKVTADTNNVLIGEQISVDIEFAASEKADVIWPTVEDSISGLEIIDDSGIIKQEDESAYSEKRSFVITSFDSGKYEIPELNFIFEKDGFQEPFIVKSNSIELIFRTMDIDTSAEIKDIKAPLDAPLSFADFLPYIIGVTILLVLIYLAYFLLKRRKYKKPEEEKYDPKIPPHILAIESLNKLEEKKLWQQGEIKQYYIELTQIIRLYIERRFEIDAMEMVTDDIIDSLKTRGIDDSTINKLHDMFRLANLAKFAKHQPIGNENAHALGIAYEFVNITNQIVLEQENTEDTKEND